MSAKLKSEQAASSGLPPVKSPPAAGLTHATARSQRGISKKLQGMMKKQAQVADKRGEGEDRGRREKYEAKNWKELTERQLNKLTPVERSRYMAYQPVSKDIQEKQQETLRRVRVVREVQRERGGHGPTLAELIESERNSELVGQLKAAEARHRIRLMRLRQERIWTEGLDYFIASQPTAIEAVRLKSFLPPYLLPSEPPEFLSRQERTRCETILEDDKGLTINRTA